MLLALAAGMLLAAPVASAVVRQPLFQLGRSKNANVVEYSARVLPDQLLDRSEPVGADWIMKAEDGRREPLSALERRFAYGLSVKSLRPGRAYLLRLKAFGARAIKVVLRSKRYVGELPIGGVKSRLVRIFVHEREGEFEPKVRSIELFGVSLANGRATHERVVPK